jgi:hypothetical protein
MVASVEERCRSTEGGAALDYLSIEDELRERTGAVERAAHEAVLSSTMVDAQAIRVDGKVYVPVCRSRGRYRTQTGVVDFERPLYREKGVRNGPTIDPIAMRIGAIGDGWLPGTSKAMAHLIQLGTSREAAEVAKQVGRLPYSRTSFERVPHVVGTIFIGYRAEIEEELIEEFIVPDEARSVSVAIDRVSIPMEEPRARPRGRPAKNAPKNPIIRQFRMAYCATVTLHDKHGEAIHTIRYGRMPQGDELGLADALASDVLTILKQRPDLEVMRLADGAHEMWKLLESGIDDKSIGKRCFSLVDLWHFLEKLAAAAKELSGDDAKAMLMRWRTLLLKNPNGASSIRRELQKAEAIRGQKGDGDPVFDAIRYIKNHRKRMNYVEAKKKGLPIGSGNVEATCKSLVQVRMKRAGSRWKEDTGDHVMQLRALALSDRWDGAMRKVFWRRQRDVRPLAA